MSLRHTIKRGGSFYSSLYFLVFYSEWNWIENGRKIIFIEDKATVERLLNLKFKSSMVSSINMPFDTFTLSVQTGTKYNGIDIYPALIRKMVNPKQDVIDFSDYHRTSANLSRS